MSEEQQQLFPESGQAAEIAAAEAPFDWWSNDDGDVVVESQSSIAVYRNRRGHVVIRGERQVEGDEDSFIHLSTPTALKALIDRLQRELREGF
jgi:hypothetical protein